MVLFSGVVCCLNTLEPLGAAYSIAAIQAVLCLIFWIIVGVAFAALFGVFGISTSGRLQSSGLPANRMLTNRVGTGMDYLGLMGTKCVNWLL